MSDYQNPFASTHSLDTNPFDDPIPKSDHAAKLEEIQRRERELEQRELALNQRAEHLRLHGVKNWPPFYPLIFHSIPDEIPELWRPMITRLYQIWLLLLGTLLLNMVACILFLVAGSSDGGKDVGASIGYVFAIAPLSFLLWYRPIYNGFMKEQSLYYYLYFLFAGFHLLFSVYMFLGIPSTGGGGIIGTISIIATQHSVVAGVFGALSTFAWAIQVAGGGIYYRKIWNHHKDAGHSIDKARTELATHGAKAYFTRG